MAALKLAITMDPALVGQLDQLVRRRRYPSRSRAIQEAVAEKLERLSRTRLARECAKLDPKAEQQLADEGLAAEVEQWPAY